MSLPPDGRLLGLRNLRTCAACGSASRIVQLGVANKREGASSSGFGGAKPAGDATSAAARSSGPTDPRSRAAPDRGESLSTSVEDYLKAIWVLAEDGSVSTNDLAAQIGVTAPSVTGMLNKLAKLDLVTYERYRGARLTDAGRTEALRLLRRHRLIETFLIDYLDYSWDEVHEEAELMEHSMTERFTERLADKLGQPAFDPHGDPIPTAEGAMPRQAGKPLASLGVGDRLEVNRILSQESEVLAYLLALGVRPGAMLEVQGIEPFGRLFQVVSDERSFALSADLAEQIEGHIRRP